MASENTIAHNVPTATGTVTDDAGGVAETHWFVAIVNHNNELNVHRRLTAMGYDSYVASQQEMRERRNGRRVKVDRLVIPSKVFIRCTEKERRQIVTLPFINRFMTDIAGRPGEMLRRPMVVIPDREMRVMQFMLGYSDSPVSIVAAPLAKGTEVEVIRGSLKGLRGTISEAPDGTGTLTVCLDILGSARVNIDPINVAPVNS